MCCLSRRLQDKRAALCDEITDQPYLSVDIGERVWVTPSYTMGAIRFWFDSPARQDHIKVRNVSMSCCTV